MIPKTLSASSLQVATLCMARWKAEQMDRIPGFDGNPALTGTACHGALEKYVDAVYIDKTHEASQKLLESFYDIAYIETFGTADKDTPEYKDGLDLIRRWYKRTDFDGVEVLTTELKERMPVPVEINGKKEVIPFTYIMDRVDRLGPGEYRVVDYKTIRVPIRADELHEKIQAKVYALAVQRKYPDAKIVRVVFDLLRHDPVGIVVTYHQNVETAHYLMAEAQRIVDTDEASIEPKLNMECGYCPIKANCEVLNKNVTFGGIHSLSSEDRIKLKFELEARIKASKILLDEIDDLVLREAFDRDELEWTESGYQVRITAQRRRSVDASAVARIIGPKLFGELGSITLGKIDDLIKDESLPLDQREELKKLITYTTGDPSAKVKKVNTLV